MLTDRLGVVKPWLKMIAHRGKYLLIHGPALPYYEELY